MTPAELIESLPDDLKTALNVMAIDRELARDVGYHELRAVYGSAVAGAPLHPETLQKAVEMLPTWLEQQATLRDEAREVFIRCFELEPPDIEGASIPAWYLSSWARTLRDPWHEHLAHAIAKAHDHLESLERA